MIIQTTLGKFCPFKYGKELSANKRLPGDFPVYGSNGIVGFHNESYVKTHGVLIGRKGSVGALHISDGPFWPIDTSFYVVKGGYFETLYTYYLLKSLGLDNMNSDSAVPGLNIDNAHALKIDVLEKEEDRAAVGKLISKFDDKIKNNQRMNETLEKMARAIFKSWFVDFDPVHAKAAGNTPAHMDADTAALFPNSFGDNGLPLGWQRSSLGESLTIKRGGSPRPIHDFLAPEGLAWTKISDATASQSPFIFATQQFIKPEGLKKTVLLSKGELILSNSATPGIPKFLDIEACIHDGWLYFPSSTLFSKNYLYLLFLTLREIFIAQGNGSVFTNLKIDIIRNQTVNIPTKAVLHALEEIIKPLFDCILHNSRNSIMLTELRDTLLPKLMSGEIRVKDVERQVEEAV